MDKKRSLLQLSPLDGRYAKTVAPLADIFSEQGLIEQRLLVEAKWLLKLVTLKECSAKASVTQTSKLAKLTNAFPKDAAVQVKKLELVTNHDVKAVEIYLANLLKQNSLGHLSSWIHFGCTSWDINNLAYALMIKKAHVEVLTPSLKKIVQSLGAMAKSNAKVPMLARTHGQPASPTTLGKEFRIYEHRLSQQLKELQTHKFVGKFNGAVGNYNAHRYAMPKVDWQKITMKFVEDFKLVNASHTTQIEAYDSYCSYFDNLARINRILLDLAKDLSQYISYGYLIQKSKVGEVGSSTMPHKTNPIDFENAEGNIQIANSLFAVFSETLPQSRLQRDLSNSTVVRNFGVAFGHSQVAWNSIIRGLAKLSVDKKALHRDLDANWQVLGEAIQTKLRSLGDEYAYNKLLKMTKQKQAMSEADYQQMICNLIPKGKLQKEMLALRPENYLGDAVKLALDPYGGKANRK